MSRLGAIIGSVGARLRGPEEEIRDFLGVVEIDADSAMGVLVLPEHVAAVLRVSGTDYAYGSDELQGEIINAWGQLLNSAGVSVQVFVLRRPMIWGLPGGFLDKMKNQVEADLRSEWQRRRYQRMEEAILRGELDGYPAMMLEQYIVLRHGIGSGENRQLGREGVMYLPPRRGIRFWERPKTLFGGGDGLVAWRTRRDAAIEALALATDRFMRDMAVVPGLTGEICSGLEISQLLHLLWREDRALDEWIGDESTLNRIRTGDVADDWLRGASETSDDTSIVTGER